MKPQVPQEFTQAVDNRQGGQFEAPPENFNRNEYYGKKIGKHYSGKFGERQANERALKEQKFAAAQAAEKSVRSRFDGTTEGIDVRRRIAALNPKLGQLQKQQQPLPGQNYNDWRIEMEAGPDYEAEYQQELGFLQEELNYGRDQSILNLRNEAKGRSNANASSRLRVQAPRPTNGPMGNKGSRDLASLQGGAPDILAQSPARAQKKVTWSPYDSSGRPVSGTQLNQLKQQDTAFQLKMGNNPYEYGSARYNYHEATNPSRNSFNY